MVPIPVHGTSCRLRNWSFVDNLPMHFSAQTTDGTTQLTPTRPYAPTHTHTHTVNDVVIHMHMLSLSIKGHSRLKNLSNEDSGCCPNNILSCVQIYDTEFGTPLYKAAAHKHTAAGQDWTNRICSASLLILPQTRLLHWNSAEQPGGRSLCPID